MPQERSLRFAEDPHDRFWWHHVPGRDYVPAVYRLLSDDEWQVMEEWYEETAARNAVGEWNPPAMSLIHGFIDGGGLHRVAQIGHYYGYSVLLVGFWLRAMGGDRRLVSIDIDEEATAFTAKYVERAGLGDHVELLVGDAATAAGLEAVRTAFGGSMPELILRDASHDYKETKSEMSIWVPAMEAQSVMLINGMSKHSSQWDRSGRGGSHKALRDWTKRRRDVAYLALNDRVGQPGVEPCAYADGCGLGILQKL